MSRLLSIMLMGSILFAGCAVGTRSPSPRASIASQPTMVARTPRYNPPPDRFVQSVLLNFESRDEMTFVDARTVQRAIDPANPTNHALQASSARIKLGALVRGREFPGLWDLVGIRMRSAVDVTAKVTLHRASTPGTPAEVTLNAGEWKTHWFEIDALMPSLASPTTTPADDVILSIAASSALLIDDLVIAQSRSVVSESIAPRTGAKWLAKRVGLEWQVRFGEDIVLRLPALPFVSDGYHVAEASPTRVLFITRDESQAVSIDRTGRFIENGIAKIDPAVMKHARTVAENASPALIEVVGDEGGRVERSLPGDRDNDGYDEFRGCYSVRATGDRITFRLSRQRGTVRWPVVEIYGLPPGPASVWVAGQTMPEGVRLADGRVVVELPIDLERPVDVQVRIR